VTETVTLSDRDPRAEIKRDCLLRIQLVLSKFYAVKCPTHHISVRGGHRGSVLSHIPHTRAFSGLREADAEVGKRAEPGEL
jgi:hypothetical protein